jgi:hypothetical protein
LTPSALSSPARNVPVIEATPSKRDPIKSEAQGNVDAGDVAAEGWFTNEAAQLRRSKLGLNEPRVAEFVKNCEFIGLGNFCGVARALQCLGLKNFSYPFDWVRSPLPGIIHCLDNDFSDFLTWTVSQDKGAAGKLYGSSCWGGSFWHHDPSLAKTKEDFTRRVERFYGLHEVDPSTSRVFVRAANSSKELQDSIKLHDALQRALPEAKIYLLIVIDLQSQVGPIRVTEEARPEVLFFRLHEDLFADSGRHWSMQKQGEAYADAIAFAIKVWAGRDPSFPEFHEVPNLNALSVVCDPFDGGNPSIELFFPQRFKGQEIKICKPKKSHPCASISAAGELVPATPRRKMSCSKEESTVSLQVPIPIPVDCIPGKSWLTPPSNRPSRSSSREPTYAPQDFDSLHRGIIIAKSIPGPVEHEMAWQPGSAIHSRAATPLPSRPSSADGNRGKSPMASPLPGFAPPRRCLAAGA